MTDYGKDITIKSIHDGKPNGTTRHRERSVKVADKSELVRELIMAIDPLVRGDTPFLEVTIKESKDARWTLVKKWRIE